MNASCALCGNPVDPMAVSTCHRIQGWEKKAHGRQGGGDVVLREPVAGVAHFACVTKAQSGIHVAQEGLAV